MIGSTLGFLLKSSSESEFEKTVIEARRFLYQGRFSGSLSWLCENDGSGDCDECGSWGDCGESWLNPESTPELCGSILAAAASFTVARVAFRFGRGGYLVLRTLKHLGQYRDGILVLALHCLHSHLGKYADSLSHSSLSSASASANDSSPSSPTDTAITFVLMISSSLTPDSLDMTVSSDRSVTGSYSMSVSHFVVSLSVSVVSRT